MPASYHGKTHLYDAVHGVVLHGDVQVATEPSGRSEIRIRNDSTKAERVLVFTSHAVRDCIKQFIDAAWEVHHQVEVPVEVHVPVCPCCGGRRQLHDRDGNWTPCEKCA